MTIETAVNISRLFIPIIAFVAIYIAWLQFTANREKIRFELYDKRFKIYDVIRQSLDDLLWLRQDHLNESYSNFETACNEAEFLLPESTCIQIRLARDYMRSWRKINNRIGYIEKSGNSDEKANHAKEEIVEIENKIENLEPKIKAAFMEVLKFEKF